MFQARTGELAPEMAQASHYFSVRLDGGCGAVNRAIDADDANKHDDSDDEHDDNGDPADNRCVDLILMTRMRTRM